MARGDIIGAKGVCVTYELFVLNFSIAQNVRVGRSALAILGKKVVKNIVNIDVFRVITLKAAKVVSTKNKKLST